MEIEGLLGMRKHWSKYLFFVLILGFCFSGLSQDTSSVKKFGFYSTPLGMLYVSKGPKVDLGFEFEVWPSWCIYLELGVHQPEMNWYVRDAWQNITGFYVKQETIYTDIIGIELMYGRQSYIRTDDVIDLPNFGDKYQITYSNKRQYGSIVVNKKFEKVFNSNFAFAVNIGLGMRVNEVFNLISEEESKHRDLGDWTVPANYIQKKGLSFSLKANFDIRVGYRF